MKAVAKCTDTGSGCARKNRKYSNFKPKGQKKKKKKKNDGKQIQVAGHIKHKKQNQ